MKKKTKIQRLIEIEEQIEKLNEEKLPYQVELSSIENNIDELNSELRNIQNKLNEEDFQRRLKAGGVSSEELYMRDKIHKMEDSFWKMSSVGIFPIKEFNPQDLSQYWVRPKSVIEIQHNPETDTCFIEVTQEEYDSPYKGKEEEYKCRFEIKIKKMK